MVGKGGIGYIGGRKEIEKKDPDAEVTMDGDRSSGHEVEWEKRSSDLFARKHVFTTRFCLPTGSDPAAAANPASSHGVPVGPGERRRSAWVAGATRCDVRLSSTVDRRNFFFPQAVFLV